MKPSKVYPRDERLQHLNKRITSIPSGANPTRETEVLEYRHPGFETTKVVGEQACGEHEAVRPKQLTDRKEVEMTEFDCEIQKQLLLERQLLAADLHRERIQEASGLASVMEDKMRVRLANIERAIDRLEQGDFGLCQCCGSPIDEERLRALPYAERCIDCQRQLERQTLRGYVNASLYYEIKGG